MGIKWTLLDKFIAYLRFSKIKGYIEKGIILCDIGCGFDGAFLMSQASTIKEGYGFDRKVTEYDNNNVHLIAVDNLERGIPLNDNTADVATLMALLEHLNNPQMVLKEVHRILKLGGRIVLTTPTPLAKPILEFLAFKLNVISSDEINDHKHYFTSEEISQLLKASGFENIYIRKFQLGCNQIAYGEKKR